MATSFDTDTVSSEEAMRILGVSRTTLYRLRQRGDLRPVDEKRTRAKRQITLRFRRADVERLNEPISQAG